MTVDLTKYIIVTEFIDSKTLNNYVQEYLKTESNDRMNPTIRSKIIFGVASIMKQMHKNKIIFRDIKLDRIVLDEKLEPKFLHNKLAKFVTNPRKMRIQVGTPLHMAPELFDESGTYSFPVDVYAYAVLLYRMFSNTYLFADQKRKLNRNAFIEKIKGGKRFVRPPLVPDHYWDLIQRCWSQNPADRPTFDEIVRILRDDKFALEEFGMKTDLKQLHEYQNRIDVPIVKEFPPDSIWSFFGQDQAKTDDETEQFHKVLSKVGEGLTSVVYKVVDTRTDQIMCKKILKFDPSSPPDFKNMKNAMKEFDILYKISHPCICKFLYINTQETIKDANVDDESGQEATTIALFLEFLEFDLKKLIKSGLNNTLKTRIVVDIVHAMRFLHKNGMIHRDLKAENIALNSVFEAKLIDFGLVRIHECLSKDYSFVSETMSKGVGTFNYMSPEMMNEEKYDYKTDVYSFGVLLHFIFVGDVPKQSMKDKLDGKPISIRGPSASISSFCIQLIKKCMELKPENRPSFNEILNELRKNEFSLASYIDKSVIYRRDKELDLFENE